MSDRYTIPHDKWNPQRVQLLEEMWAQGFSAAQIANELSRDGVYFSRNSVIGKKSRMRLPGRPQDQARARAKIAGRKSRAIKARIRARKPAEAPLPPQDIILPPDDFACVEVSLMDLTANHCRSVLDKQDSHGLSLYCGNPVLTGKSQSFCAGHHKRYFQPYVRPSRRPEAKQPNYRPPVTAFYQ